MVPPTSEETHTSLPSGVNFASRGRVSTSTFGDQLERGVVDDMRHARALGGDHGVFEVGAHADALGLDADRDLGLHLPVSVSMTVAIESSSLAM